MYPYYEEQKKYFIKREQDEAKGDLKVIKRDFFDDLPMTVTEVLNRISWRWKNYDWFEEAWNKYRQHVLDANANGTPVKAPGFVFNDYIDEQVKEDFLNREQCEVLHSDLDINELCHHGIKGQRWGIRRYQNLDGSLTDEGKKRYGVDSVDQMNDKQRKMLEKDQSNSNQAQRDILQAGKDTTNILAERMSPRQGSKKVNKKDYSKMTDDELRKKVNRLSLERQYGDLTGDNKYVMSGREKTREVLQTIGAILGVGVSAVTIAAAIKTLKP